MNALVTRDGTVIRKGRVSPALRTAITLIVTQGISIADAAQRTGYKLNSLQVALRKPHVMAERAAVKRAWLDSKTDKAWVGLADLAEGAASEDVRLKAIKIVLDAAGELDPRDAEKRPDRPTVVINVLQQHGQPIPHQLPGVIEAQPIQRVRRIPSNSEPVGRGEGDQ